MKILSECIKWPLASALDLFWTPVDTKELCTGRMDLKTKPERGKTEK